MTVSFQLEACPRSIAGLVAKLGLGVTFARVIGQRRRPPDRFERKRMGMNRDERQLEGDELVDQFAEDLRELRLAAGKPTYEKIGRLAGCSKSTVHEALTGTRLPSLAVTLGVVRALGANDQQWRDRWTATRQALDEKQRPPNEAVSSEKSDTHLDPSHPGSDVETPAVDVGQHDQAPATHRKRRVVISLSLTIVVAVFGGGFLVRAIFFGPQPSSSAVSADYSAHADFYRKEKYFDLVDDQGDSRSAVLEYRIDHGDPVTRWNIKGSRTHKKISLPLPEHALVEYRACTGEYHKTSPDRCGEWATDKG